MKFLVDGIQYDQEEANRLFVCKFCNTSLVDLVNNHTEIDPEYYIHEDQFGSYFCENKVCIIEHAMESEILNWSIVG